MPYVVSSDTTHVDRDLVYRFLRDEAYWSLGLPRDVFDRGLEHSLCFSAFDGDPARGGKQAGFARVVTDRATFAWLCDVFVLPAHRGRGVSKRLLDAVMAHPDLERVRNSSRRATRTGSTRATGSRRSPSPRAGWRSAATTAPSPESLVRRGRGPAAPAD